MKAEFLNEKDSEEDIVINFTENNTEKADLSNVSIKTANNSFAFEAPKILNYENIYESIINNNPIVKTNTKKKNKKNPKRKILTKKCLSKITEISEESKVFHSSLNNNYDDSNSRREFNSTVNSKILKNKENDLINESRESNNYKFDNENIEKNEKYNKSLIEICKIDNLNLDNNISDNKYKNDFIKSLKIYEIKRNCAKEDEFINKNNKNKIFNPDNENAIIKMIDLVNKGSDRNSIDDEKIKVNGKLFFYLILSKISC